MQTNDRLLRRPDVQKITGMTRYMIDMLEDLGGFPKRMQVGHRAVFWSEAEVIAFLDKIKQDRGHGVGNAAIDAPLSDKIGG
jgi:prophage regulatory protein